MRSTALYTMPKINPYGIMMEEVVGLLNNPPKFGFSIYDVIEQEEEQLIVCYPEIDSDEIVFNGEIQLYLRYGINNTRVPCNLSLENPTWKMLLNSVNDSIIDSKNNYSNLHNFDITGLLINGMGYQVEAILMPF